MLFFIFSLPMCIFKFYGCNLVFPTFGVKPAFCAVLLQHLLTKFTSHETIRSRANFLSFRTNLIIRLSTCSVTSVPTKFYEKTDPKSIKKFRNTTQQWSEQKRWLLKIWRIQMHNYRTCGDCLIKQNHQLCI